MQKPLGTGDTEGPGNGKGIQSPGALPKTPPASDHGEHLTRSIMQGTGMSPKTTNMTQSMDQIVRDPMNAAFGPDMDDGMASMPMLEFMLMPPQANAEMHDMGDSTMMDVWKDMELPSDIRDLLSGFSTY
jgi:hypothetical protein